MTTLLRLGCAFSVPGSAQFGSCIIPLEVFCDPNCQAFAGSKDAHSAGMSERYIWGQEGFEASTLRLRDDDEVVKIEIKSFALQGKTLLVQGVEAQDE